MMETDVFAMASFARYRKDADKELDARADAMGRYEEWMQVEFGNNPREWQEEALDEAERQSAELADTYRRAELHVQILDCIERAMTCVNISAQMLDSAYQLADEKLLENDDSVRQEVAWAMSMLENLYALNQDDCPWK